MKVVSFCKRRAIVSQIKIAFFSLKFITLSALFAVALAAPQHQQQQQHHLTTPIPILKYESTHNHDGSYQYAFETGNGISQQEQGYVKNLGVKDSETQVAQGFFSYTSPDGTPVHMQYVADENGFVPTGSHIPTPPPQPKEIQDIWDKINAQLAHQQPQPQYQQPQQAQQQYYNNKNF